MDHIRSNAYKRLVSDNNNIYILLQTNNICSLL